MTFFPQDAGTPVTSAPPAVDWEECDCPLCGQRDWTPLVEAQDARPVSGSPSSSARNADSALPIHVPRFPVSGLSIRLPTALISTDAPWRILPAAALNIGKKTVACLPAARVDYSILDAVPVAFCSGCIVVAGWCWDSTHRRPPWISSRGSCTCPQFRALYRMPICDLAASTSSRCGMHSNMCTRRCKFSAKLTGCWRREEESISRCRTSTACLSAGSDRPGMAWTFRGI
jgi:hypothetical protein